nr:hypothetical protein pLIS47_00246c [Listeria ivanovii]UCK61804.1 hypothetical protein pLIS50_00246c [Listeria seeligeri]UCK61944.1 hypothetical protein pLIS52_00226c [Listeria seeligeri]
MALEFLALKHTPLTVISGVSPVAYILPKNYAFSKVKFNHFVVYLTIHNQLLSFYAKQNVICLCSEFFKRLRLSALSIVVERSFFVSHR